MTAKTKKVEVHPLTADRWKDLERLFGPRGACGGCWCMWFRLTHSDFERRKGASNKRAFKRIVASGAVPGLIAYVGGTPAGWCAVAPREAYPRLERSRILKRVDDRPVWSLVCLFVAKEHRGAGVTRRLVESAVEHARSQGAEILEAYPVDAKRDRIADAFAYHGLASTFRQARWKEVARRSETRPIMRRHL